MGKDLRVAGIMVEHWGGDWVGPRAWVVVHNGGCAENGELRDQTVNTNFDFWGPTEILLVCI